MIASHAPISVDIKLATSIYQTARIFLKSQADINAMIFIISMAANPNSDSSAILPRIRGAKNRIIIGIKGIGHYKCTTMRVKGKKTVDRKL